jgi:hypothetical protein
MLTKATRTPKSCRISQPRCDNPPSVGRARSIAKLPIGAAIQASGLTLSSRGVRRMRNIKATQPSRTVVPSPEGRPVERQWAKFAHAKTRKNATSPPRETMAATRREIPVMRSERGSLRPRSKRIEASKDAMRAEEGWSENDHEHDRQDEDDHRQEHLHRRLLCTFFGDHLASMT